MRRGPTRRGGLAAQFFASGNVAMGGVAASGNVAQAESGAAASEHATPPIADDHTARLVPSNFLQEVPHSAEAVASSASGGAGAGPPAAGWIDPGLLEEECEECVCGLCFGVMVKPASGCPEGHSFCRVNPKP